MKTNRSDGITQYTDDLELLSACDINQHAQDTICDFMGGIQFTAIGWNDYNKRSVMLTREFLQELIVFYLAGKFDVVIPLQGDYWLGVQYYCVDHETWMKVKDYALARWNSSGYTYKRIYVKSGTARNGMRNQHAMSGRIE